MSRISQREARRLKKRAEAAELELDLQRNAWAVEWPRGTHIGSSRPPEGVASAIRTARKLRHAVVVIAREDGETLYYALPLGLR